MKTNTLTRFFICACWSTAALVSTGFVTSTFAGPERLDYGGKEKQVEMVQPEPDPRWFVSIGIGTDFDTEETDFSNGLQLFFDFADALNVPLFADVYNRAIQGVGNTPQGAIIFEGLELNIAHRSWDDIYKQPLRFNFEFGRRMTDHIEIFGKFNYVHADGDTETGSNITLLFDQIEAPGGIIDGGPFELVFPFETKFSDFNSYGGELGFRYLFMRPDSPIRPYVSIAGGGTWTDGIHANTDINVFGFEFNIYDHAFYNDSFVGTGALMVGFQSRVTRSFSVGVEAGIRYESTLGGADIFENLFGSDSSGDVAPSGRPTPSGSKSSIFEELESGLHHVNHDAGDRLVIPLVFWAKYRFW